MLILIVVAGILFAAIALCVWSIWRARRVDFIHQVDVGTRGDEIAEAMFDRFIPVLVGGGGYAIVAQGGNTTVFERRYTPGWAFAVAILVFPVGLIALLASDRQTVTMVCGDQTIDFHGFCSNPIADLVIAMSHDVVQQVTEDALSG